MSEIKRKIDELRERLADSDDDMLRMLDEALRKDKLEDRERIESLIRSSSVTAVKSEPVKEEYNILADVSGIYEKLHQATQKFMKEIVKKLTRGQFESQADELVATLYKFISETAMRVSLVVIESKGVILDLQVKATKMSGAEVVCPTSIVNICLAAAIWGRKTEPTEYLYMKVTANFTISEEAMLEMKTNSQVDTNPIEKETTIIFNPDLII